MTGSPTLLAKDRVTETATAGGRPDDAKTGVTATGPGGLDIKLPVPDPRQVYDLRRIAKRYDLRSMSGTDAVRLARDLVDAGFEEADALALTLPISSRNLMSKMGKVAKAPRIESWTDLMLHHTQHLHGARGVDRKRLDQLARMCALAEVLAEAEQGR
jgi:hypothetical protein